MDFVLAPGEELVQCPYNRAHQVTNTRLLAHLQKCSRQNKKNEDGQEMVICRYNAVHHLTKRDIFLHEQHCPDASIALASAGLASMKKTSSQVLDQLKPGLSSSLSFAAVAASAATAAVGVGSSAARTGISSLTKCFASVTLNDEENWEAGASSSPVAAYDPQQKLSQRTVVHQQPGMTRSERRQFRRDVREMGRKLEEQKKEM